jgi:3-oxoadipate enol-lactonase
VTSSVEGAEIAWEAVGPDDAPVLVFTHSLGSDRSMWRPQVAALQDRYRVVVIDTRGHGRSAAPDGQYSIEQLGNDVLQVADDSRAASFHYCGISLGGITGLWLAIQHPHRVRSLVAANTAARIGSADTWQARIDAIRAGGMEVIRETVIGRWFSPGFAASHPDWFAEANAVFAATNPIGYIGCCAALAVADLRDVVPSITVPVLVIGGSLDLATPPADAEWLHAAIGGSELTVFDGAAHLSNLDRHEEFTARLRRFLAR